MAETAHALLVLIGAAFASMVCGGALAFGIATVCRWMEWAPVNTTVNIYNNGVLVRSTDPVGSTGDRGK